MPPDGRKACGLPAGEGLPKGYALAHRRSVAPNEGIKMRTEGQRLSAHQAAKPQALVGIIGIDTEMQAIASGLSLRDSEESPRLDQPRRYRSRY